MTGLLGGGHAIYWDAARGRRAQPRLLLRRAERARGGELLELEVPFGEELVHYAVGPPRAPCRASPPGSTRSGASTGGCPGRDLCAPALRLAREGVPMPPAHVACLAMLEPVMTMREGARIYAPGGRLLRPGEPLEQPGLVRALELARRGGRARASTAGSIAESLLALVDERGRRRHARRPRRVRGRVDGARSRCRYAGTRFLTRGGPRGIVRTLERCRRCGSPEPDRTLALLDALDAERGPETHTTNLVTVDARGNACVLTTSLGLGSGDWLPGLDLHLNSMLGEVDLLVGELQPGRAGCRA